VLEGGRWENYHESVVGVGETNNRMLSHVQLFGVWGILFGFNVWSDYGG